MEKQLFIVTDLGGGDGGKGGVVHKLSIVEQVHTVIKAGGGQGSHGVRTSRGEAFNFSHFGCGTLEGVKTHIPPSLVIDPLALVVEGEMLKYGQGLSRVFDLLTIDGETICSTPFHRIASRLRELARKGESRGTIGTGIGEAFADADCYPHLVLRARDTKTKSLAVLCAQLEAIRRQKVEELKPIIIGFDELDEADQPIAQALIAELYKPGMVSAIATAMLKFGQTVNIVDPDYLGREILSKSGAAVIECSHGILTDKYYGFHPHTSKLRTLPEIILRNIAGESYDGEVVKIGITRAYQIRHGAGPMVTEDPTLVDKLLPGSSKEENRWQGKVRVGPLDFVALRYAINVCGGPQAFDALAVTWFDQIKAFGEWLVCDMYQGADDRAFFTPDGEIVVRRGEDSEQLKRQWLLGEHLRWCKPVIRKIPLPAGGRDAEVRLCQAELHEHLGVPVRMISFGPTENDKVCI
jgi:adenylosuccinate synthase